MAGVLVTSHQILILRIMVDLSFKKAVVAAAALCAAVSMQVMVPGWGRVAQAEPLAKEHCAELAGERTLLEGGGAGESLQRGPEWAKANLTPEQIGNVRRLIEVREDLLFRCRDFEPNQDASASSSAPAMAPLPTRKPVLAKGDRHGVPAPVRPARAEAKVQRRASNRDDLFAPGSSKPELRGTLPATPKAASEWAPEPVRKTKPEATSEPKN